MNLNPTISLLAALAALMLETTGRAAGAPPTTLTLKQAGEIALRTHPRISAAELRMLAARQVTVQVRAAFFPNLSGNITAVGDTDDNTRLAAGTLNVPTVIERAAGGLTVSQLITDFGRTANLAGSAKLRAQAEEMNVEATRDQILLQVNYAYFTALEAQSVVGVAQQTVTTRQLLLDQVQARANNKLNSELDVSFAGVTLEEGQLLLAQARKDLKSAFTTLSALLGNQGEPLYELRDEAMPAGLPVDTGLLVSAALKDRPDLARLRFEYTGALRFAAAEKGLNYPTLSAVGAAGTSPIRDPRLQDNYAAAGINLSIPLFSGNLYTARQREAELRARAVGDQLRDEENNVIRDVRLARLDVDYAIERVSVTARLLEHAAKAFTLAQERYKVGASSIVEMSQAQLNQTAAEIAQAGAKYELQIRRTVLDFQMGALK